MPPKRTVRQSKEDVRTATHPYKLRSRGKKSRLNTISQDRPAEKIKHHKALREQAVQIIDKKELGKFPVEQLRRLAAIKRIHGQRKQSIMRSFRRVYGESVPLYPSEGRVEMREYSREEYQIGLKKVIRVDTCHEVILKMEEIEDMSVLSDPPELRRSCRLRQKAQLMRNTTILKPPQKKICRRRG